ncbi:MAG: hypothetical protein Q8N67_04270, partial [Candidatus Omnitrophota bacterium]|nr:hypothetical protein [Candidatus Omnitrophota bacterium]
ERIMNGLGGEGVGPAWNSSFHLYIRLDKILKTNAIAPDEWKLVKEYFGEAKSALASMETAGGDEDEYRYRRADIVSGGESAVRLMAKFSEYRGEVYYPCAGYDNYSLQALINIFPNASRFVLNDSFNQNETSLLIPSSENIVGIVADLYNFFETLKYSLGNFRIQIINTKTLRITIKVDTDEAKALLKRDSIEVLYKIGDYKEESGRYGVIYVQTPGMAGSLSEFSDFYTRLLSQLKDNGALLVSRECTFQPATPSLINVASIIANTEFDSWLSFVEPWEVYKKQSIPIQTNSVTEVLSAVSEETLASM